MSLIRQPGLFFILAAFSTVTLSSCSFGPAAIKPPSISPSGAASKAMELYDKNGDGKISDAELDAAPAIKASMATLDTNGDKAVTADEIVARIKSWQASPAALTGVRAKIMLDGAPLAGAEVIFEPDPCLGDDIKPAKALSTAYGDANPVIPPEMRPTPKSPPGVQLGFYLVRISKVVNGKETIPAKYNTQTILGQEVSYDDPAFQKRSIAFNVKSAQ